MGSDQYLESLGRGDAPTPEPYWKPKITLNGEIENVQWTDGRNHLHLTLHFMAGKGLNILSANASGPLWIKDDLPSFQNQIGGILQNEQMMTFIDFRKIIWGHPFRVIGWLDEKPAYRAIVTKGESVTTYKVSGVIDSIQYETEVEVSGNGRAIPNVIKYTVVNTDFHATPDDKFQKIVKNRIRAAMARYIPNVKFV